MVVSAQCPLSLAPTPLSPCLTSVTQVKKADQAASCLMELQICAEEKVQDAGRLQAALESWDANVAACGGGGWSSPDYIAVSVAL